WGQEAWCASEKERSRKRNAKQRRRTREPAVARQGRWGNARRPFSLGKVSGCQTPRSITLFKLSERSTRSCARHRRAQSFAKELVSPSQNGSGRWRHRPLHRYFRISSRRRDKPAMQREESWHCQRSTKR